jgi:hypothetical protein
LKTIPYELYPVGYAFAISGIIAIVIATIVVTCMIQDELALWGIVASVLALIVMGILIATLIIHIIIAVPYNEQIHICSHLDAGDRNGRIMDYSGNVYVVGNADDMLLVMDGDTINATLTNGGIPAVQGKNYIYRVEKPAHLQCKNQSGVNLC